MLNFWLAIAFVLFALLVWLVGGQIAAYYRRQGRVADMHSAEQIAHDRHLDLGLVKRVICMIDRNEYKRQQAAPGLKISAKAFGYGRRFPIAARYES